MDYDLLTRTEKTKVYTNIFYFMGLLPYTIIVVTEIQFFASKTKPCLYEKRQYIVIVRCNEK